MPEFEKRWNRFGRKAQGVEDSRATSGEHHAGRLRRLASRGAGTAAAEPSLERYAAAIVEISEHMIEQDHRSVKSRIKPMLGFKGFDRAAVTITGVELLHRIHNACPCEAATKGRWRIHFVATHFSPRSTGLLACSEAWSSWSRLLQYSK